MSKKIRLAFIRCDRNLLAATEKFADADAIAIYTGEKYLVSVKDELSGRSEKLLWLGKATRCVKGLSFVSLLTDNFGFLRRSVAVFSKGRLVCLADETAPREKKYSAAYGYKTAISGEIKFGVAVGKDLIENDCLKCLSLSESDAIINLSADFYDYSVENLVSALSYIHGIPIISVNAERTVVADGGKTILSSTDDVGAINFTIKKSFSDRTVRRRGK